jgi:phosphatidate phosphatase LPIN
MNYLRGAVNAISAPYQYYKDINPSTLTGAIDVIVVRKPTDTGDIELACTPFHVRFGKWQVLRPSEKKVSQRLMVSEFNSSLVARSMCP